MSYKKVEVFLLSFFVFSKGGNAMKFINIGPENENREYKRTTSELKEAIISLVAMLNKHSKAAHKIE